MNNKDASKLISVQEAADLLGYSRQHVLRLINSGEVSAQKIGRNFVVDKTSLPLIFNDISKQEKSEINRAVDKVFKEYGDVIKKLSKE
jgi:excisionase family DNA binding protein